MSLLFHAAPLQLNTQTPWLRHFPALSVLQHQGQLALCVKEMCYWTDELLMRASPDLKTCFQNFGQNNEYRGGGGRPDLVNMFSGKKRPPANIQDGCIGAGKQSRIVWLSRP